MKKKTVKSLITRIKPIFSEYIRKRDCLRTTGSLEYGDCISCDRASVPYLDLDAGHFIPKHNSNLFSERGVHAQCRKCNRFQSGNQLEYRRQIIKLYGEGADLELEVEARQIKQFTIQELEDLERSLKAKIAELEQ